jgi:hypothetical protein
MNNPVVKIGNGLMMVQSYPFNWIRESVYANLYPFSVLQSSNSTYYYYIYLGDMSGGTTCVYKEEENELSISDLKFKVESIEEAGEIVLKLTQGMGKNLEGTVHESATYIRDKKIEKILN